MAAGNSIDLDRDPRSIIGVREFDARVIFEDLGGRTRVTWRGVFPSAAERSRVIKEYGADKGLAQTLARLEQHVSELTDQTRTEKREKRA